MIPRTLVPLKLRPVRPDEVRRRRGIASKPTWTTGPWCLPAFPTRLRSTARPTSPRICHSGFSWTARSCRVACRRSRSSASSQYANRRSPIAVLDSRVVVPAYVEPADAEEQLEFEHAPEMTDQLREVIEPDIFMTGDANLLMEAKDKRDPKSDLLTRVLSVLVHIGLIIFLIFTPKIFPPHVPTQQEIDLAQAGNCSGSTRRPSCRKRPRRPRRSFTSPRRR